MAIAVPPAALGAVVTTNDNGPGVIQGPATAKCQVEVNLDASGTIGQGFNKVGQGTLTLTGANTYAGGTTLNTSTLQLGNGDSTTFTGTLDSTNANALIGIAGAVPA